MYITDPFLKEFENLVSHYGEQIMSRHIDDSDDYESYSPNFSNGFVSERDIQVTSSKFGTPEEITLAFFRLGVSQPLEQGLRLRLCPQTNAGATKQLDARLSRIVRHQEEVNKEVVRVLKMFNNCPNLRKALEHYLSRPTMADDEIREFGSADQQRRYCQDVLANFLPSDKADYGWLQIPGDSSLPSHEMSPLIRQAIHHG